MYILSEEQLEDDELNSHECMISLMNLLDHMQHNKITPEITEEATTTVEMPPWMAAIHKKMKETVTEKNICLFLARLITNRPKVIILLLVYFILFPDFSTICKALVTCTNSVNFVR